MTESKIFLGDSKDVLLSDELEPYRKSVRLVYVDPPFRTQKKQVGESGSYEDKWEERQDYLNFLQERITLAWNQYLTEDGSIFVHLDFREIHYVKVMLDQFLGEQSFMNEIIWSYDYGGRSKKVWPKKHDNILWYAKNPKDYVFNFDDMDRIPYMAPELVGPEKAARGKTPTDVWFMTIEPTMSKDRTKYPTQKPTKLLERIIKIHSNEGDLVMDFFGGSGTTAVAALKLNRNYVLIDKNPEAFDVINKRLDRHKKLP